jgi:hypothetical protein
VNVILLENLISGSSIKVKILFSKIIKSTGQTCAFCLSLHLRKDKVPMPGLIFFQKLFKNHLRYPAKLIFWVFFVCLFSLTSITAFAATPLVWTKCNRIRSGASYQLPKEMASSLTHIPRDKKIYIEGQLIWEWQPYKLCYHENENLALYGAALKPGENCGVETNEPLGILALFKNGKVIYQKINPTLAGRKIRSIESDQEPFLLYHSYQSQKKISYLKIIDHNGRIIGQLDKPGRHDFLTRDLDGDRTYEISGYGLKETTSICPLVFKEEQKKKKKLLADLYKKLGVKEIKPRLDKQKKGKFSVFLLKNDRIMKIQGKEYKNYFLAEADSWLKKLEEICSDNKPGTWPRSRIVNSVASFYGILEAIGDQKIINEYSAKLPEEFRNLTVDLFDKYWSTQGYHGLNLKNDMGQAAGRVLR